MSVFQGRAPLFSLSLLRDIGIVLIAGILLAAPVYLQSRSPKLNVASTYVSLPDLMGYSWYAQNALALEREKRAVETDASIDLARHTLARQTRNLMPFIALIFDDRVEQITGISPLTQWYLISAQAFRDALEVSASGSSALNISYKSEDPELAKKASRIVADLYVSSHMPVGSIASNSRIGGTVNQVMQPTKVATIAQTPSAHLSVMVAGLLGCLACAGVVMSRRLFEPAQSKFVFASPPQRQAFLPRETKPSQDLPRPPSVVVRDDPPEQSLSPVSISKTAPVQLEQTKGDDQAAVNLWLTTHSIPSDVDIEIRLDPSTRQAKPKITRSFSQIILVTSLYDDDAGLLSALHIGHSLATTKKTVFIEIDSHSSADADLLGVSDFIFDQAHFEDIIHPLPNSDLHFIPFGHARVASCHGEAMFDHFMRALSKAYDTLIVHVESVEHSDMALEVASYADMALVCTHDKNKKRVLKPKMEAIRAAGVDDVLGVCTAQFKNS